MGSPPNTGGGGTGGGPPPPAPPPPARPRPVPAARVLSAVLSAAAVVLTLTGNLPIGAAAAAGAFVASIIDIATSPRSSKRE